MKQILFYTDTPNVGGAEKQMAMLAGELKLKGYSVSLAYGKYSALRQHPELLENYDRTFVIHALNKHDPRHYFELRRILEIGGLLHIHLWNPGACRYAFFAAASAEVPVITTEHDPFELHGVKWWIKKACLKRTAHTIAISSENLNELQKWYDISDEKISLVHNGIPPVSPRALVEGSRSLDVARDDMRITCVAELHERKGHKYLLEAFEKLLSAYPNLHLQLVGTGPLEGELRSRYGTNPNIHFLGWRNDVPEILSQSDIFVLPSLKEAFGLSILEAMVSGVPVIGTDSGGIKDIIEPGRNGLLVPPADSEALAQAMEQLITHPEEQLTLAQAGQKRALDFSVEKMAVKTMAIYASVLRQIPSPSQSAS